MTRWVLPLAALALLSALAPAAQASHAGTIRVGSDADLVAPHWSSAAGTPEDPIRPTFSTLVARDGYALEIANVRKHVNLSGLTITGGAGHSDAIRLVNVRNVTVWGATLETNRVGIHIHGSRDVVVAGSTVKTSATGILLEGSRGVMLRDNRISLNDRDVQLKDSWGNTLRNNNLSTATGQIGLHFDDNRSWDNSIDPTNVVNAMPVRWYTNVVGGVLGDFTVDLAGITNVAQVMVYNATDVRLERVVAKSGVGNGIVVHRSANVTLERPTAENNAQSGLFLELSNATRVANGSARTNGASGALLRSTRDATLEWSTLRDNAGEGVRVAASADRTTLHNLTLAANAQRGVVVESSGSTRLADNALASDALLLVDALDVKADRNSFTGAGSAGISLTRAVGSFEDNVVSERATAVSFAGATGSNFTGNTIALAPGGTGFAFDGPASYDNALSTTNLVNGTPLRWYTNVAGPVRLEGLSVETRGITNVAQIMVYRSHNVTLASPIAANGSAAGIVVRHSSDTTITGGSAVSNAAEGILVDGGNAFRLERATVRASGGDGVRLRATGGALVENTVVADGRSRGLAVEDGSTPTLRGNAARANAGDGIVVQRVGPGAAAVDHNTAELNGGSGIVLSQSTIGSVRGNTITSNGADGLVLANVPAGVRVDANTISGHTRDVKLGGARGTVLTANTLTIRDGQWGVHFDDEASYDVTLDPTNTVNGVPLRWYVGATNVTLAGARAELRGLTNVAQVMLYRVANVTLEDAVAANGTAHGVHVFRSENVTMRNAHAENNTKHGVMVEASRDVRLNGSRATRNVEDGARVDGSVRTSVNDLATEHNRGKGLSADLADALGVRGGTFDGNDAAGIHVVRSSAARIENATVRRDRGGIELVATSADLVANNTVEHNGERGIAVSEGVATSVDRNALANHTVSFSLDRTSGSTFTNNTVTFSAAGQTAWSFASELAYANDVGPTNFVNGTPMRWYATLRNATIEGIRAEQTGLTNVAQIGLIAPSNVTLLDATAANGTGVGILVVSGSDVDVLSSTARSNAGAGLRADGGASIAVRNASLASNGGPGASWTGTGGLVFDNVSAADNRGHGLAGMDGARVSVQSSKIVSNGQHGVLAQRAGEINVSRTSATGNALDGIHVAESTGVRLYDNVVTDARGAGLAVRAAAAGARIEGNRVTNASFGVRLAATQFAELRANALAIGDGQIGLQLDDETSYNNVIPTTNTVNGAPVHWYTTLAGTESQPISLAGVRAEVRGMTNVAQVMLYRSAYVTAPDLVATNGTARGVYLYRSSAVTLDRANLTGNALYGADLHATQSSTLRDVAAQGSGVGARLSESLSNHLARVNASGATTGVWLLASSRDNRVEGIEVDGSARGIRDDGWNGAELAGSNLLADAGATKRGRIGAAFSFADLVATYRHDSTRIVEQRWSWGDGTPDTAHAAATLLKPTHVYAAAGWFRANLTLTSADGQTLRDSVWVEAVPPLSAPRTLLAAPGDRNVTLAWQPPEFDGASPVTAYRVYRGTDPADLPLLATIGPRETRYVDASLENGRTYIYLVASVNADGEGPRASVVAVPVAPPGPPRSLVATPSPNAVALAWEPPAQLNGAPLAGYVVLRSTNGAPFAPVDVLGNATTYADRGLLNGVPYTYAVRAYNMLGNGTASANASATPVGPPGVPQSLRALPGDASATLLWGAPADTGGSPVNAYRVWRGVANASLAQLPVTLAANATTWRDTGLSNGERYLYAVTAVNAHSEGTRGPPVEVVPAALDALRPVVYAQEPAPGAVLKESPASIAARFVDNDGVVLDSVRLYIDGAQVGATIDNASARYAPPAPLAPGEHTVRLVVRDPTGNEADEAWTFRVLGEEEIVASFEQTGHALVPERARPNESVTARLTVRNVGHLAGTAVVRVVAGERTLALETVALAEGAWTELALSFPAPELGEHAIVVGDTSLRLVVVDDEIVGAPTPAPPVLDPAAEEEAPAVPVGARKPVRSVPPPREDEATAQTPLPVALVLVALAATALRRRRR